MTKIKCPDPSRRAVIAGSSALVAASLAPGCVSQPKAPRARPNVIFIMADDLGYADLSCYGRRDYQTLRIDSLASSGIRFTNGYSNSPVCSATRTALMTGQYQYRLPVGLEEPLNFRPVGLPPSHPTLPSLLRDAGYQTALVGKWHLGMLPDYGPLKSGYDHFWGFRSGSLDYFTHNAMGAMPDLWDGDVPLEQNGYVTELLGDRTVEMIDLFQRRDRPFFLSMHFSAPHWPWEGPDDGDEAERLLEQGPRSLTHFDGGSLETYARMVTSIDAQVGRVLDRLDALGIADNTIVVFTSDNGGERFSDNWPFTGIKTELLEGGIRVPLIVRWPGHSKPGSVTDQVAISMDFVPTLLSAAGAVGDPVYPFDGVDLSSAIAGEMPSDRKLFFRYKHLAQEAHRNGNWKYLKIADNEFLFNIESDPMERANLKLRYPEVFTRLVAAYREWDKGMLPIDPESFTHGYDGKALADHFDPSPSTCSAVRAFDPRQLRREH